MMFTLLTSQSTFDKYVRQAGVRLAPPKEYPCLVDFALDSNGKQVRTIYVYRGDAHMLLQSSPNSGSEPPVKSNPGTAVGDCIVPPTQAALNEWMVTHLMALIHETVQVGAVKQDKFLAAVAKMRALYDQKQEESIKYVQDLFTRKD